MSQEDVDLVLAFYAAYNARELDAAVDLCAVDLNAVPNASVFPESGSLVGRDELRGFLEETWTAWASGGDRTPFIGPPAVRVGGCCLCEG